MDNKPIRNIVIVILILVTFSLLYIVINKLTTKEDLGYDEFLKNYEVNEYIPMYISDEQMAKIYLNDFIHKVYYEVDVAYQLIDKEYRTKKFGSFENFKSYINSTLFSNNVKKYYTKGLDENKIFGTYDEYNNLFIFKTNGVMQYTVYLDDYTVEI